MAIEVPVTNETYQQIAPSLPLFDGYPYLTIRICPSYHQILLLPSGRSRLELSCLAWLQAQTNRLTAPPEANQRIREALPDSGVLLFLKQDEGGIHLGVRLSNHFWQTL